MVITSLIILIRKRRGDAFSVVAFWTTNTDPASVSILTVCCGVTAAMIAEMTTFKLMTKY